MCVANLYANAGKPDPDSYCDSDCHGDADRYSYSYCYIHGHTRCYRNSYSYSYSQAYAHCQAEHNTESASYPTAASAVIAAWRQSQIGFANALRTTRSTLDVNAGWIGFSEGRCQRNRRRCKLNQNRPGHRIGPIGPVSRFLGRIYIAQYGVDMRAIRREFADRIGVRSVSRQQRSLTTTATEIDFS